MDRLDILRSMLGSRGPGLEIGPLHQPIAPKADGYDVEILDHASTEQLRVKYKDDQHVTVSLIETVDHVSSGRSMLDVISDRAKYDWIVASHVIEHTPDMLGFLLDCQTLLKPGGRLVLAVPHRRFCFDALRPLTSMGQLLQAHLEKRSRHSPGTIFDYVAELSTRDGFCSWGEGHPGQLVRNHSDAAAWDLFVSSSKTTAYHDVHGWVYVPASFRLLIETAHGLGITSLRELSFHPPLGCEFYVCLADGGAGPGLSLDALRRASEEEQLAGLLERFDLLPSRPGAGPADAPGGEAVGDLVVKHLRATYADLEERRVQVQSLTNQVAGGWSVVERSRLEASLATTERRVAELRDQIEGLHRSNSWRVTKPARALTRMLHEAKGRLLSGPHVGGLRTP